MMFIKSGVILFCAISFWTSAMDNHRRGSGSGNSAMGKSTIRNMGPGNVYIAEVDLTVNQSSRMDMITLGAAGVATMVVVRAILGYTGAFGYQNIRYNRQNGNDVRTEYIASDWTLGRLCKSAPSMVARLWSILRANVFTRNRATLFPWPPCPSDYVFAHQYARLATPKSKFGYRAWVLSASASMPTELPNLSNTVYGGNADTYNNFDMQQPVHNADGSMPPDLHAAYAAALNEVTSGQPEPSAPLADPVPGYNAVSAQYSSPYNPMFVPKSELEDYSSVEIPLSPRSLPPIHKKWQITTFQSHGAGTATLTFNPNQSEGVVTNGRVLQKIKDSYGSTYKYSGMNDITLNLPGVRDVRLTYVGTIEVDGIGESHGKDLYDFSVVHSGAGNLSVNPHHQNLFVKTLTVNNSYVGDCRAQNLRAMHVNVVNFGAGSSYVRPEKSVCGKISYVGQVHCYIDHLSKKIHPLRRWL